MISPQSQPAGQWSSMVYLLQNSLYAEEMVCSMSTQLFHIPQTKDLLGNREMHEHLMGATNKEKITVHNKIDQTHKPGDKAYALSPGLAEEDDAP